MRNERYSRFWTIKNRSISILNSSESDIHLILSVGIPEIKPVRSRDTNNFWKMPSSTVDCLLSWVFCVLWDPDPESSWRHSLQSSRAWAASRMFRMEHFCPLFWMNCICWELPLVNATKTRDPSYFQLSPSTNSDFESQKDNLNSLIDSIESYTNSVIKKQISISLDIHKVINKYFSLATQFDP